MADFTDDDLSGSRFERVNLTASDFTSVDLSRARFRSVDLHDVVMNGVELLNVRISGELENVVVNGVDVGPLIEAELDRRNPLRAKMRPTDAAGFRTAWDIVEQLWDGTVARARTFAPDQLHESVDEEWSFIETLRHLAFATDAWVRRGILGDPAPWDRLDLPWDQMPNTPGVPRDRAARPSSTSRSRCGATGCDRPLCRRRLTDESLAADTTPVDGPGWPPPRSFPVRQCLLIVLNEEWHHRLFAERDLDALHGDAPR